MSTARVPLMMPQSPTSPTSASMYPSMVARALQIAHAAVQTDAKGTEPQATMGAYARCVALLDEVLQGASLTEQESRKLQTIRDAYAGRVRALAEVYGIGRRRSGSVPSSPVTIKPNRI